jgi:hypothetical protein
MYKRECLEYGIAPLQSIPVLTGQHCASVLRYARMSLFSGRFLVAASHLCLICFVTGIREGYLWPHLTVSVVSPSFVLKGNLCACPIHLTTHVKYLSDIQQLLLLSARFFFSRLCIEKWHNNMLLEMNGDSVLTRKVVRIFMMAL